MQRLSQSDTTSTGVPSPAGSTVRPDRPCDSCRRRKTRCVLSSEHANTCILCAFHNQPCTFLEDATPRRRKIRTSSEDNENTNPQRIMSVEHQVPRRQSTTSVRPIQSGDDYAHLQGSSLLKKTLGLQNHQHARYIGSTDIQDIALLAMRPYDNVRHESVAELGSFRQVAPRRYFRQRQDVEQADHSLDMKDVDEIEQVVAPHGYALIRLYFRIIHPTFPILHKKVYLEKYARSHREFAPPLLAAVYLIALKWWSYSAEVAELPKPNMGELEDLALHALWRISRRSKLSTVQAGLLLSQIPGISCWTITSLVVGMAQDLGLHLDCTNWQIPSWERGLRKRLAWAVFMQDTWSALIYGRPPHISLSNWGVQAVTSNDFPESAADEDDEDGSTEVEKGRTLFSAMITLTKMLYEVLENMYSLKAETEVDNINNSIEIVLAQAKPIQIKLRSWYAQMPDSLQITSPTKVGKLDSVGYLHLAYYATEMTIHRKVLRHISDSTDPYLVQVCRTAAKSRLVSAMDFFDRLKPEHLQSFWYFASTVNFALIGMFAGLCLVTSTSSQETEFYWDRLQKYRWALRVGSSGAEILKQVSDLLTTVVEPLTRLSINGKFTKTRNTLSSLIQNDAGEEQDAVFGEVFEHAAISQFLSDSIEADPYI